MLQKPFIKNKEGLSAVQFKCNIPVSAYLPSKSTLQDHVCFCNWAPDATPVSDSSLVTSHWCSHNLFQTSTHPVATTPPPCYHSMFLAKTPVANINPGDVTSYGNFDKLDFLDSQACFNDIFNFGPKLIASDVTSCPDSADSLSSFADRILIQAFISSYKIQYLGKLYDNITSKAANLPKDCSSQSGTAVDTLQAEVDLLCEQHSQYSSQLLKFQYQSPAEFTLPKYEDNPFTATCPILEEHKLISINGVKHIKKTPMVM
ncbi:predicted protein [Chaetoceros tenuissimus]|uniref:Uncharacterized protein n=1 Tax=Chaetoceros tenuissimus TaxID=426638 RepID=A0AAD3DD42_9STRA|nr:predicted protein [Chaetoceros tenuissimus]